jgi:hypothetical protein
VAGRVDGVAVAGTAVRTRRGTAFVDDAGSFLVPAEPGDEVVVDTDPVRRATVPSTGTVIPT